MRARFLENASTSTAPILAGATLSFMSPVRDAPIQALPPVPRFGHIPPLPAVQSNVFSLRQFHGSCPSSAPRTGGVGRMDRGGAASRDTSLGRPRIRGRWLAPLIAAGLLSGCGSMSEKMAGTLADAPAIGLPADAPSR